MLRFILAKILFHRTRKWNKKRSKMFDGEKKILYFIYRLLDRRVRLRSIQMKAAIEKSSSINRNGTLSRSSLLNEFPSKLTYRLLLHFQLARIVTAVHTHIYACAHIYIVYVQFIGISHIREYIIYLLYLFKNDEIF